MATIHETGQVEYFAKVYGPLLSGLTIGIVYVTIHHGKSGEKAGAQYVRVVSEPGDSYGDIHAIVTNIADELNAQQGAALAKRVD